MVVMSSPRTQWGRAFLTTNRDKVEARLLGRGRGAIGNIEAVRFGLCVDGGKARDAARFEVVEVETVDRRSDH